MAKAWRIVIWIAAAILVIGLVLAGVGWLTGASVTRAVDLVFGSKAQLLAEVRATRTWLLQTLGGLADTLLGIF